MNDDKHFEALPAFASGGFVKETGLAVVHQGEYIMPASGSEAVIEPAAMAANTTINYYFPVEIELVGAIPDDERADMEARIWSQLTDALQRTA